MQTKWFSKKCFLKNYSNKPGENDEGKELYLTALETIEKNERVACFSSPENISPNFHYIRHNLNPTCYLVNNDVFAIDTFRPNTELTLNFDGE